MVFVAVRSVFGAKRTGEERPSADHPRHQGECVARDNPERVSVERRHPRDRQRADAELMAHAGLLGVAISPPPRRSARARRARAAGFSFRCGIVGPSRTTITSGYDFRKAQPARWLGPALLSFQSDLRNSREAESSRRRRRYVNNATTHKGAAVVDGQDDRTSTTFVRDPHFAAERQRAVCGGERRAIELLTACDSASAFVGIDRGEAGLICCRWCEINGANLTS